MVGTNGHLTRTASLYRRRLSRRILLLEGKANMSCFAGLDAPTMGQIGLSVLDPLRGSCGHGPLKGKAHVTQQKAITTIPPPPPPQPEDNPQDTLHRSTTKGEIVASPAAAIVEKANNMEDEKKKDKEMSCLICRDVFDEEDDDDKNKIRHELKCGHVICTDCYRLYIDHCTKTNKPIVCPTGWCNTMLLDEEKNRLRRPAFKILLNLLFFAYKLYSLWAMLILLLCVRFWLRIMRSLRERWIGNARIFRILKNLCPFRIFAGGRLFLYIR